MGDRHHNIARAGADSNADIHSSPAMMTQPKPWKQDFKKWSYKFVDCVRTTRSARRVWRKIQSGGFPDGAALLLYFFRIEAGRDMKMYRRTAEANRKLKAAIRAIEKSAAPTGKRGPTRKAANQIVDEALACPWPAGGTIGTIEDAVERIRLETGRTLPLTETRTALLKFGGQRSPLGVKLPLVHLQVLADKNKVKLGYKAIALLAGDPRYKSESNKRELQRYLKSFLDHHKAIYQDLSPCLRISQSRAEFSHLFAPPRSK